MLHVVIAGEGFDTKACRKQVKRGLRVSKRPVPMVLTQREAMRTDWLRARCGRCGLCPKFMAKRGIRRLPEPEPRDTETAGM